MSNEQEVTVTERQKYAGETEDSHSHPAFGAIQISRTQGHPPLAGVEHTLSGAIVISIHRASWEECDGEKRHSLTGAPLMRFYLSPAQWSELVSFPAAYSGVPCTFAAIAGESIPQLPSPRSTPSTRARAAINKKAQAIVFAARKLHTAIEGLSISKKAAKALRDELDALTRIITDHMPFLHEIHVEELEKARIEAGTALRHHAENLGLVPGKLLGDDRE